MLIITTLRHNFLLLHVKDKLLDNFSSFLSDPANSKGFLCIILQGWLLICFTLRRVPHISTTLEYSRYFSWGLTRGKRLMKWQFSTSPHQYWPYQDIMRDRRLRCLFPVNIKSLRVIKIQWITNGAKSIYRGYQSLMVYKGGFSTWSPFWDGH